MTDSEERCRVCGKGILEPSECHRGVKWLTVHGGTHQACDRPEIHHPFQSARTETVPSRGLTGGRVSTWRASEPPAAVPRADLLPLWVLPAVVRKE